MLTKKKKEAKMDTGHYTTRGYAIIQKLGHEHVEDTLNIYIYIYIYIYI